MPTRGADATDPTELRRRIQAERQELVRSVAALRRETDLRRQLGPKVPLLAAAAFATAFVVAGGLGALLRLLWRHRREGREVARLDRFALVDRSSA